MEYIKLSNGTRYAVASISESNGLQVSIFPDTSLLEVYTALADPENTQKMTLETEDGEAMRIFNGYVDLTSVSIMNHYQPDPEAEPATVIQAAFAQPDRVQEQITELQSAVIELAGMIGG